MIQLHGLLRLSTLFAALAAATAAHALGVGEVSLNSRLNQPLNAQIALFEANGLDADEVTVKLASPEAFERVGLDRPYFLTDLKFKPALQGAKGTIAVTSSKPIREPYLSFLIEVIWPNGRMLREYTLLLDPPIYAPAQSTQPKPVQLPTKATAAQTVQQQPPQTAAQPAKPVEQKEKAAVAAKQSTQPKQEAKPEPAKDTPSATADKTEQGKQYQTQDNDRLWDIASNFTPSGATVHQTMLAIQDLNPKAFIDGNINLLKKGQVLRLPDQEKVSTRTPATAIREVAQQNEAWRESRGVAAERQVNATRRETVNAASQGEVEDSLRLVSTATSEDATANRKLNERLAAAQEDLDSSRRENEELKSRIGELEGQIDKLQRLVELSDANLATLQAKLANSEAGSIKDIGSSASSDAFEIDSSSADSVNEVASIPAINEPSISTTEETSNNVTEAELKWWEHLLNNPMMLWGAGGSALVLLLVMLINSRRNAKKWSEREQLLDSDFIDEDAPHDEEFTHGLDLPDSSFNDLLTEEESSSEFAQKKTPVTGNSSADDAGYDPFAQTDITADKDSTLRELDELADFDLKFSDEVQPTQAALALPEKPSSSATAYSASTLNKEPHGFDFVTADESPKSSPFAELDDFSLDDKDKLGAIEDSSLSLSADDLDKLDFGKSDDFAKPKESQPTAAKPSPYEVKDFRTADKVQSADDDFDFLSGTDETETKLDLARAYIDMGDMEGARDILGEVMSEGSDSQQAEARELMTSLVA